MTPGFCEDQNRQEHVRGMLELISISMHMQKQTERERGGIVLCCAIVCCVSDEVLC